MNSGVVQMVDPVRLVAKGVCLRVTYIESVIVTERSSQQRTNLRLPPHPRDLQIDYTSPTFLIPQRVKFRYRLDGYDRDWHDAGTRRQAFYTDLPPGTYSFRVIASNSDGVWNDSAATAGFLHRSGVLPDQLVSRSLRGRVSWVAVGGLPVACPAIASSVRADAGCARRRAHADCAGTSRHSAAKRPWCAAPLPNRFPVAAGAPAGGEREAGQRDRADRGIHHRSSGCRCRDCAIPQSKATISHWP